MTPVPTAAPPIAGRLLADRYRLLQPLGAGSSGRVVVAEDLQLERRVAVKVLHEGFAGDAAFLERFRAEARIAASLHHPHIVTVHDWGDAPVPFIVLELLTGGSLASLVAGGHRLSPAQAAALGVKVASALEHAHGRGLVHRDVKPANLLFDEHGEVRVADFGLARALAEARTTEPRGTLIGTARYAAPEQAGGAVLDARADLYALALVLAEAVTGEVPLTRETPMATLATRARWPVEATVDMGPLGVVVEGAGKPDPVDRYPSGAAMRRALERAAAMLPPPEPLPVAGLDLDPDDAHPTEVDALLATAVEEPEVAEPPSPSPEPSRRRRMVPLVVGLVLALLIAGPALALLSAPGVVVHVPNLLGQSEQEAAATLSEAGLLLDVSERVPADDPPGTIIEQSPEPGEAVGRGDGVVVVVSAGAPPVPLPSVVGDTEVVARQRLGEAGFEVVVDHRYDEGAEAGRVAAQAPTGAEAPRGSAVTIIVSDGPAPRAVPNVVGMVRAEAVATLEGEGFAPDLAWEYSDSVELDKVVRQEPVGGQEAVPGDTVRVVISNGPNTVEVPDVRGRTVEEATTTLEGLDLEADVVNYRAGRLVKSQDPAPGESVRRGTTVTLFL